MTVKFVIQEFLANINNVVQPYGSFTDIDTNTFLSNYTFNFDYSAYDNKADMITAINAVIVTRAGVLGYSSFTAADVIWLAGAMDSVVLPRSQSSVTRTIATSSGTAGFLVSASRDAEVRYSADISCTLSLTAGQSGTLVLEIANNSAMTGAQVVSRATNSNSGTLTVGLGLTQVGPANLTGYVPAGWYVRLRSINNTGSPTFTYQAGQEVLL